LCVGIMKTKQILLGGQIPFTIILDDNMIGSTMIICETHTKKYVGQSDDWTLYDDEERLILFIKDAYESWGLENQT